MSVSVAILLAVAIIWVFIMIPIMFPIWIAVSTVVIAAMLYGPIGAWLVVGFWAVWIWISDY